MGITIGLIPARGGSKRVPGKNKRLLNGKPLIQYSIEHSIRSKNIDITVVNTDSEEIAEIARGFDCRVQIRPENLAGDKSPTVDVVKYTVSELLKEDIIVDYIVLLQPTVPIRNIEKIDEAVDLLKNGGCDSVISYILVDYFHPNRMKKIVDRKVFPYCEDEIQNISRDELPKAYYRDGSIYAVRSMLPLECNTLIGTNETDNRAVINDRDYFINIDTENDWLFAEILIKKYEDENKNKNK